MRRTREYVAEQMKDKPPLTGPLLAIVHYRLPVPPSAKAYKKRNLHLTHHHQRPDGDNLEKFLNDALQGLMYTDDCQISWILRSKTFINAREGETILHFRELKSDKVNYEEIMEAIQDHIEIMEQ